jgi:hypothetical protein
MTLFLWCVSFSAGKGWRFVHISCAKMGNGSYKRLQLLPPVTITRVCILSIYSPIMSTGLTRGEWTWELLMAWELSDQAVHSRWRHKFNNPRRAGWSLNKVTNCVYGTHGLPVSLRPGIIKQEWQHLLGRAVVPVVQGRRTSDCSPFLPHPPQ